MRGSPAVLVILPKLGFVKPVTGFPRWVAFSALNASKRYSTLPCSPMNGRRHPLANEVSIFAKPGPIKTLRPRVPKVFGAGLTKRVVSKYAFSIWPLERPVSRIGEPDPIRSARAEPAPAVGLLEAPMLN